MSIVAFPKIAAIGTRYVENILSEEVEITEKVDGSQFVFGWDAEGVFHCRSKGKEIHQGAADKMFLLAVDYTSSLHPRPNLSFYCEYLQRPKHNTLAYSRTPVNHLMLFGVSDFSRGHFVNAHADLCDYASQLRIEPIPLLYQGSLFAEDIIKLVNPSEGETTQSALGGADIEGVVIKNYHRGMNYGERAYPIMCAKYVTEKFKERHSKNQDYLPRSDKWQAYMESLRTDARWQKAVWRRRDAGQLLAEPKDIGPIIKDIQADTLEEHKDEAKEILWGLYGGELTRKVVAGFPEWYKEKLALGEVSSE